MSWKTVILIAFLILVTIGLVYLSVMQPASKPTQSVVPLTPSPAHTTLSMVEEPATTSSQHVIDVVMDTKSNKVTAAQIELGYDPKILTNVSFLAGDFFTQPTILLNDVNTNDGRASFALGAQIANPSQSGKDIVAKLVFSIVPGQTGSTKITFMPKTQVTAEGVVSSVLQKSTDLTITLGTLSPTSTQVFIPTVIPTTTQ